MAKFNKYSSYKNSDIDYCNQVPSHWNIQKLKLFLAERKKKNKPIISTERLSLSIDKGVTLYAEKTTNKDRFKEDFTQYQIAYPNDLVLNSMNVIVGASGVSKYLGCVSPAYYVLYARDTSQYSIKYFYYIFKTAQLQKKLYSIGRGIMAIDRGEGRVNTCRLKISRNDLSNLLFPIPPVEEQKQIVKFIEYKEKQINKIIKKQKKLIELLEEKKKAVITDAVTKGLDKSVPMKDSGVDYIGKIPQTWEVVKLKQMSVIISKGTTPTTIGKEILPDAPIMFIKGENIQNYKLVREPYHSIDLETNNLLKRSQLKENDILYVIAGSIGKVAILKKEFLPANTSQAIAFIRLKNKYNHKFVWYCLQSNYIKEAYTNCTVQSAQPNLSMGNLGNFLITQPNYEQQESIVNMLDTIICGIDKIILNKFELIKRLEEYKKTLISNAVTGQIDVRDYVIPEIIDDIDVEESTTEELDEVEYANC